MGNIFDSHNKGEDMTAGTTRTAPVEELVANIHQIAEELVGATMDFQRVMFGHTAEDNKIPGPDPIGGISGQLVDIAKDIQAVKDVLNAMRERL